MFRDLNVNGSGQLLEMLKADMNKGESFEKIKTAIFDELKKSDVKAEFALDLIYAVDPDKIVVPQYINEGLRWLETILCRED